MEKSELKIEGMHCVSCEKAIGDSLRRVPGVSDVKVNFVAGEAEVTLDPQVCHREDLISAVAAAGYSARPIVGRDEESIGKGQKIEDYLQLVIVLFSALCTLPLLFQMIGDIFGMGGFLPLWVQFVLSTIVQFGFGWRFYAASYWALKTFTPGMDLLITLGTTAAWGYSTIVFIFSLPLHVYFEASATIITLVLLGRYLEARTKKRAGRAMGALIKLQPKLARLKVDGSWFETPAEELKVGDTFQVRPGEKVPIDGLILEGSTHIDESMLTGESAPAKKNPGDKIYAATQNQYGSIIGKATSTGDKTALSEMIRLVKEAQNSKAPIQKLADRISAYFVPIVLAISLLTFLIWWGFFGNFTEALVDAVAVLVVACPCALGMATPVVIMVSAGVGAKEGILIKNGEAIEKAQKIKALCIDKTGTLTEGKPRVTDSIATSSLSTDEMLNIAASLEEGSEHPIAKAITSKQTGAKKKVQDFIAEPGRGVSGKIENKNYYVGSLKWLKEKKIQFPQLTPSLLGSGKTLVGIADDDKLLGVILISDALRQGTKEAISTLKDQNIETYMITGDIEESAKAIGEELRIGYAFELLPKDKVTFINKLKASGKLVGMVGDGVNDAPPLAASDVSFAMRTGTDIAIEAADITLMKSDIRSVPDAIDLSRATFRKIKQNLFFAFIYNIVGIPLAFFGLLNPMIAGAAMAASSLTVVVNALLLNRWTPKKK